MKNLRIGVKLGLVIGVLLLTAVAIAAVGLVQLRLLNQQIQGMVEVTAQQLDLMTRLRVRMMEAIRYEKNSILSTDDSESKQFAERANQAWNEVEEYRRKLMTALLLDDSPEEEKLMVDFNRNWEELRKMSKEILAQAALNTNTHATTLLYDPAQRRLELIRVALNQFLKQADREINDGQVKEPAKLVALQQKTRLAGTVADRIAEIHRVLGQHINSLTDADMNRLDQQIREAMKEVDGAMEGVGVLLQDKERVHFDRALLAWTEFKEQSQKIQELSHTNSNLRSIDLSINKARPMTDECLAILDRVREGIYRQLELSKTESQSRFITAFVSIMAVTLLGIGVSLALSLAITRGITRSLGAGVSLAEAMAHGDLTRRLRLDQEDEIGQLAKAIDVVADSLTNVLNDLRNLSGKVTGSSAQLSTVSQQLLTMSGEMSGRATTVAGATEQMTRNISTMAAASEEMSMNVSSISSASEEISVNIATISAAAEQTSSSVRVVSESVTSIKESFLDIARDARAGSQVTTEAMTLSSRARDTMNTLDRSAGEINKVTDLIKMIALQTNLLALNATIEATAAGEAGKGFAVVAHEIKELANQSARAAEDIAKKIEGVQTSTRQAVEVIQGVAQIISTINTSAERISDSVARQTEVALTIASNVLEASRGVDNIAVSIAEVNKGTTDMSKNAAEAAGGATDMSKNAAEAAKATDEVASSIFSVSEAARQNTAHAEQVNGSAQALANIAGELQKIVGRFKVEV